MMHGQTKIKYTSITYLCWRKWRTFWRKNAVWREGHQGGLVLARQCPGSLGTCNPEETGLTGLTVSWSLTNTVLITHWQGLDHSLTVSWSLTLFSGSDPVGLPPVPWTEKTIEWLPFFVLRRGHCCRRDLVGRTNFWIFFSASQKLEPNSVSMQTYTFLSFRYWEHGFELHKKRRCISSVFVYLYYPVQAEALRRDDSPFKVPN